MIEVLFIVAFLRSYRTIGLLGQQYFFPMLENKRGDGLKSNIFSLKNDLMNFGHYACNTQPNTYQYCNINLNITLLHIQVHYINIFQRKKN